MRILLCFSICLFLLNVNQAIAQEGSFLFQATDPDKATDFENTIPGHPEQARFDIGDNAIYMAPDSNVVQFVANTNMDPVNQIAEPLAQDGKIGFSPVALMPSNFTSWDAAAKEGKLYYVQFTANEFSTDPNNFGIYQGKGINIGLVNGGFKTVAALREKQAGFVCGNIDPDSCVALYDNPGGSWNSIDPNNATKVASIEQILVKPDWFNPSSNLSYFAGFKITKNDLLVLGLDLNNLTVGWAADCLNDVKVDRTEIPEMPSNVLPAIFLMTGSVVLFLRRKFLFIERGVTVSARLKVSVD